LPKYHIRRKTIKNDRLTAGNPAWERAFLASIEAIEKAIDMKMGKRRQDRN